VKIEKLQWKIEAHRGKKQFAKTCLTGGGKVGRRVFVVKKWFLIIFQIGNTYFKTRLSHWQPALPAESYRFFNRSINQNSKY